MWYPESPKVTTDIKTNSLTPYTGVCGFLLSVKFASSKTHFARRWKNVKQQIPMKIAFKNQDKQHLSIYQ